MTPAPEQDPRTYFAAERTFLAWIRTGLGLMGVGFAVSRFGIFLRQFHATQPYASQNMGRTVISGVVLVALGVVVNLAAVYSHLSIVRRLQTGTWKAGEPSKMAIGLALLLAALGVGMAIYLIMIR
jgi:putative membrane protein